MIETEQTVAIAAPIDVVWAFARDIRGWAALMPGMQACDVVDDDSSRWTLKVGVGGLVRTVRVDVHVEEWAGPSAVRFTYRLVGDPVTGSGAYAARSLGPTETEVALRVRVEGGGPMAPMWEAMGRPLLPQLARGFAGQFKQQVEAIAALRPDAPDAGDAPLPEAEAPAGGLVARLRRWLARLFGGAGANRRPV